MTNNVIVFVMRWIVPALVIIAIVTMPHETIINLYNWLKQFVG